MRKSIDNVNRQDTLPEDDPLELIHTVMHQYRSQQYQVLRDGPHDITHMESKVLGYVHRHPGATQSDLSRDSGRDKAQLARLIKGLRERELLASVADPIDKRNLRLSLTPQGQSVLRVLQQQSQRLAKQAVTGLDAGERRQLVALLQRVSKNFGTAR